MCALTDQDVMDDHILIYKSLNYRNVDGKCVKLSLIHILDTYTFTWMSKKLLAYIFKNYLMSQSVQETFKKKNSI